MEECRKTIAEGLDKLGDERLEREKESLFVYLEEDDNKKKKGKTTGKLLPTEDEITIEEKFTYDIKRKEFDIEPFNDAELEIAHLDFNSSDSEEDTKEKIKTLLIYNRQLKERDYQKEFVINNQLESMESIINKTEILKDEVNKEICKNLSKLARFTSKEIFTRILLDAFKYRELRNKKRILGMILQEKNSELNQKNAPSFNVVFYFIPL